jgi:hypothetical protein
MQASVFARIINKERQSDGTLIVTGIATDDTLDVDKQICDPEWLARAMPEWFKYGNIREQHSNIAAGVATKYEQDGTQHIVTAHVVDPSSVMKVESGVLKGFSIGIRDPRISHDKAAPGGRIVDGEIVEVSLVDRPANPSCMLELAKSTGGVLLQVETLIEKEDGMMERCKMCKEACDPAEMKAGMCMGCADKAAVDGEEVSAVVEEVEESEAEEAEGSEIEETEDSEGSEDKVEEGMEHVEEEMDRLAAMEAVLAEILSMLKTSDKRNTDTTEEAAKSVKSIDERLAKVEKSASRGPVRTLVKAAPVAPTVNKAAEYRAKAAATSDPALASGYLLLASEAESN